MRTALGSARKGAPKGEAAHARPHPLLDEVVQVLDDAKATDVVTIDLKDKASFGDHMVIASGLSDRHVRAVGSQVKQRLKELGHRVHIEGEEHGNWVLIDTGSIIVHIFRPEVREFYNLERMWSAERPEDTSAH